MNYKYFYFYFYKFISGATSMVGGTELVKNKQQIIEYYMEYILVPMVGLAL